MTSPDYDPAAMRRLLHEAVALLAADELAQEQWLDRHATGPDELVLQLRDLVPTLPRLNAAGLVDDDTVSAVVDLDARCREIDARAPLSDPAWSGLRHGARAVLAQLA